MKGKAASKAIICKACGEWALPNPSGYCGPCRLGGASELIQLYNCAYCHANLEPGEACSNPSCGVTR